MSLILYTLNRNGVTGYSGRPSVVCDGHHLPGMEEAVALEVARRLRRQASDVRIEVQGLALNGEVPSFYTVWPFFEVRGSSPP